MSGTVLGAGDRDEFPTEWERPQHTRTNDSRVSWAILEIQRGRRGEIPIPDGEPRHINGSFLKKWCWSGVLEKRDRYFPPGKARQHDVCLGRCKKAKAYEICKLWNNNLIWFGLSTACAEDPTSSLGVLGSSEMRGERRDHAEDRAKVRPTSHRLGFCPRAKITLEALGLPRCSKTSFKKNFKHQKKTFKTFKRTFS